MTEPEVDGLYIDRTIIKSQDTKAIAANQLWGWKRATVSIDRWIDCHQKGFVFVPGILKPFTNSYGYLQYTHSEALWHGTRWFVIDYDNDDGVKLPRLADIPMIDPDAEELFYAVCESSSSRVGDNAARGHGFVLLESPIIHRERFDALMFGMRDTLLFMTGAGRAPTQPCYGNAREDQAFELYENVLTDAKVDELCEIGYTKYAALCPREVKEQARDRGYTPSRGAAAKKRDAKRPFACERPGIAEVVVSVSSSDLSWF